MQKKRSHPENHELLTGPDVLSEAAVEDGDSSINSKIQITNFKQTSNSKI
jgi:hypothetical protein